ncbi:hypothetical protein BDN67DRAFT_875952, partial [Paxillus ammoniavirescens]
KQAPNQRVAHVLLQFNDPHPANKILKDGLYVFKEKLCLHKHKKEPVRCANCHDGYDTCAKCGEEHRTNMCTSHETRYCVSCEDNSHCSNDRHCPAYKQECTILNAKHPESSMPYFPTNESW